MSFELVCGRVLKYFMCIEEDGVIFFNIVFSLTVKDRFFLTA